MISIWEEVNSYFKYKKWLWNWNKQTKKSFSDASQGAFLSCRLSAEERNEEISACFLFWCFFFPSTSAPPFLVYFIMIFISSSLPLLLSLTLCWVSSVVVQAWWHPWMNFCIQVWTLIPHVYRNNFTWWTIDTFNFFLHFASFSINFSSLHSLQNIFTVYFIRLCSSLLFFLKNSENYTSIFTLHIIAPESVWNVRDICYDAECEAEKLEK